MTATLRLCREWPSDEVASLFFKRACVESLASPTEPCPLEDVGYIVGAFVVENQVHVEMVNIIILFVLFTGTQLGGVPRPGHRIATCAFLLWILTTLLQWACAILSFTLLILSYTSLIRRYGACLVPFSPLQPRGPKRIHIVALGTFFFQPLVVSKLVLLVMQPLALVSGIRGVERSLQSAGPALRRTAEAILAGCHAYLYLMAGCCALGYAATLVAWLGSAAFVFGVVFASMLAVPLATGVGVIALLNGLASLAKRCGEAPLRQGAVTSGDEPWPAGGAARGVQARSRSRRWAELVQSFFGFNLYWCEWAELRRVDELLRLSETALALLALPGLALLLPLRALLSLLLLWSQTWRTGPFPVLQRRVAAVDAAALALLAVVRRRRRVDWAGAGNHLFAAVFVGALLVHVLSPLVVYCAWSATVLYAPGALSGEGGKGGLVRSLYAFAFRGFRAFRVPALAELRLALLEPRALAELFRSLASPTQPSLLLAASRSLALLALALGAAKLLSLGALLLLLALLSCGRARIDVLPLGVSARMSAAVDPAVFAAESCELGGRLLSPFEVEAVCANKLRGNTTVTALDLRGTLLEAEGLLHLARAVATMPRLRQLRLGEQPRLAPEGARALGRALGLLPPLELLELGGVRLPLREVQRSGLLQLSGGGDAATGSGQAQRESALPQGESQSAHSAEPGEAAAEAAALGPLHCVLLAQLWEAGHLRTVHALRLSGCALGDAGLASLAPALPRSEALRELSIVGCSVGGAGARALAQSLGGLRQLQALALGANPQLASGAAHLLRATAALGGLRELRLEACQIDAEHAGELGCLPPGLQLLELGGNAIGSRGCEALAGRLAALPLLARLGLRGNGIGDRAVVGLAEALGGSLTSLDLAENLTALEGTCALASALGGSRLRQLEQLWLGGGAFGDECAQPLAEGLQALAGPAWCPPLGLRALPSAAAPGVSWLPQGVAEGLLLLAPRGPALRELDLSPSGLGVRGVLQLARALGRSPGLLRARLCGPGWLEVQTLRRSAHVRLEAGLGLAHLLAALEVAKANAALRSLVVGASAALAEVHAGLPLHELLRREWVARRGAERLRDLVLLGLPDCPDSAEGPPARTLALGEAEEGSAAAAREEEGEGSRVAIAISREDAGAEAGAGAGSVSGAAAGLPTAAAPVYILGPGGELQLLGPPPSSSHWPALRAAASVASLSSLLSAAQAAARRATPGPGPHPASASASASEGRAIDEEAALGSASHAGLAQPPPPALNRA